MTAPEVIDGALKLMQLIVAPVISYGAWVLTDIRNQLRSLNGRLITQEQWARDHDKGDDMRFHRLERDIERLHEHQLDLRGPP